MSGPKQLVEQLIIELLLQHLDNEVIGQLLNKAPLKQGLSILPTNASNIARNKAIQELLSNKNLKYVISVFESGQFNSLIQTNYEEKPEPISLDELKVRLTETEGLALDSLLSMISKNRVSSVVQLFKGSAVEVNRLSEYIDDEGLGNFRFQRRRELNTIVVNSGVIALESQIKKLQSENQRLQKKKDREIHKIKRDFENQIAQLNVSYHENFEELENKFENEITVLKIKLSKAEHDFKNEILKNKKLNQSIIKLNHDLEIQRKLKRPSVLVVGNLPENSILDEQKYRIFTIAKIDSKWNSFVATKSDVIKVYLQSEYVSMSEYLEIKKNHSEIPMEYLSRENMKKGN